MEIPDCIYSGLPQSVPCGVVEICTTIYFLELRATVFADCPGGSWRSLLAYSVMRISNFLLLQARNLTPFKFQHPQPETSARLGALIDTMDAGHEATNVISPQYLPGQQPFSLLPPLSKSKQICAGLERAQKQPCA